MSDLFIKPADKGSIIRDPETLEPLSSDGENKPASYFWHRRIEDGSVILAEKPEQPKTTKKEDK